MELESNHFTVPKINFPKGGVFDIGITKITSIKFTFYKRNRRQIYFRKITVSECAIVIFCFFKWAFGEIDIREMFGINKELCHGKD